MKLTNQKIISTTSTSKRVTLIDGRGLELRVSPNGLRTWALLYWFEGKKHRYTIGPYPAVSLKQARQISDKLRAEIAHGRNPQVMKRFSTQQSVLTVDVCYTDFLIRHLKAKLKSWHSYDQVMKKDFTSRFGKRNIKAVSKADIIKMIDHVVARGAPIHANRLLQYVKRFFSWCVEMDYIEVSPAISIPKPVNERSRERVLTIQETYSIYEAANELGVIYSSFIKLLILSGHRRSELSQLKWDELADEGICLARERSKNDRPIVTPLTDLMKKIINEIPRNTGAFVFSTTSGRRPIAGFSKIKKKLDALTNISDWRLHDFRRTIATNLEEIDVDRFTVKCVLNHSDASITGVYDRSTHTKRKLRALENWEQQLFGQVNIVHLAMAKG